MPPLDAFAWSSFPSSSSSFSSPSLTTSVPQVSHTNPPRFTSNNLAVSKALNRFPHSSLFLHAYDSSNVPPASNRSSSAFTPFKPNLKVSTIRLYSKQHQLAVFFSTASLASRSLIPARSTNLCSFKACLSFTCDRFKTRRVSKCLSTRRSCFGLSFNAAAKSSSRIHWRRVSASTTISTKPGNSCCVRPKCDDGLPPPAAFACCLALSKSRCDAFFRSKA